MRNRTVKSQVLMNLNSLFQKLPMSEVYGNGRLVTAFFVSFSVAIILLVWCQCYQPFSSLLHCSPAQISYSVCYSLVRVFPNRAPIRDTLSVSSWRYLKMLYYTEKASQGQTP